MEAGVCRRSLARSADNHGEPVTSTNTTNASPEQRLKDLGINLPDPPTPLGAYVEAVHSGSLLFLSGTLPVEGGVPKFLGRVGGELSVEDGRRATRLAALNALALAKQHLGSLDRVTRVVRLGVLCASYSRAFSKFVTKRFVFLVLQ
jgi:enamine deaminase RidA (YjgF/YER057c/UK114 family)